MASHPPPIWHRRGLRKSDPLSATLFVLVMNMLTRVLTKAIEVGVLRQLACHELRTTVSVYAEDVEIFCHSG
jgi:hypothetical protein